MSAQSKPHDLTELQRLTVASNSCRVAEPCRKYGGGLIGTGTIGAPWGSMHLCLRTMFLCVRKRDLLLTSLSTTYQILALKEEFPSLPSLCLGCSQLPESLFLDLPPPIYFSFLPHKIQLGVEGGSHSSDWRPPPAVLHSPWGYFPGSP